MQLSKQVIPKRIKNAKTDIAADRQPMQKTGSPQQLSDGGGLYLQARDNGKYWHFRYYRPSDNKRDEMKLGVYPEISLKEAKEKREELCGLIAKGIDSKLHQQDDAQKQAEQLKNTFEAIARKWHSDQVAKPNKWKPDHAQRVIRSLELHIFPDLATRKIDEIMLLEVLGLLQRLESAGKYDMAQKVYDVVNQVFKYAVPHGGNMAVIKFCLTTGNTEIPLKKYDGHKCIHVMEPGPVNAECRMTFNIK